MSILGRLKNVFGPRNNQLNRRLLRCEDMLSHINHKLDAILTGQMGSDPTAPLDHKIDTNSVLPILYIVSSKVDELGAGVLPIFYSLSEKVDALSIVVNSLKAVGNEGQQTVIDLPISYVVSGKIDELGAGVLPILYSLSEKVDALSIVVNSLKAARNEGQQTVIEEIDRLDGYIGYHIDKLRGAIDVRVAVEPTPPPR